MSDADRALWQKVTADIDPLEERSKPDSTEAEAPAISISKPRPSTISAASRPGAPTAPPGAGLDRRSSERLRKGQYPIEGRLDLHGMTVERAHNRLNQFISEALARDKRMVLVITGKGRAGGEGILRREVPIWLSEGENRGRVLAVQPARPGDGGQGALYVLLRRNRTDR